jgi:hypothetical protein
MGSNPSRLNYATPQSNSSRENGLAGATIAIRSPDFNGRGFLI